MKYKCITFILIIPDGNNKEITKGCYIREFLYKTLEYDLCQRMCLVLLQISRYMRMALVWGLAGWLNDETVILQMEGQGSPKNTQKRTQQRLVGMGGVRKGFLEEMPALSLKKWVGIKHTLIWGGGSWTDRPSHGRRPKHRGMEFGTVNGSLFLVSTVWAVMACWTESG